MPVKKQQLELDMEQQTGSKLGKEYVMAVYLLPCLFNLYAEYIMRNAGLDEAQAGIKIAGENINNLRYADDTNLNAPVVSRGWECVYLASQNHLPQVLDPGALPIVDTPVADDCHP